jgi:hypothetical protein
MMDFILLIVAVCCGAFRLLPAPPEIVTSITFDLGANFKYRK